MSDIVLPAGTKMRMLNSALGRMSADLVARRPHSKSGWLDLCVLFVLFNDVDRATGITKISHAEIAARVGVKERAAERSTARLAARGEIKIKKTPAGKVYGGRGGKNSYHLLFERASDETPIKERFPGQERAFGHDKKGRLTGHDTLSLNLSHKNPLRAGAGAEVENQTWRKVQCRLAARLGDDVFQAWIPKLSLEGVVEETVTFVTATKFFRAYIIEKFFDRLLDCWREEQPTVQHIQINVRVVEGKRAADEESKTDRIS